MTKKINLTEVANNNNGGAVMQSNKEDKKQTKEYNFENCCYEIVRVFNGESTVNNIFEEIIPSIKEAC